MNLKKPTTKTILPALALALALLGGCSMVDQAITLNYAPAERAFGRQNGVIAVARTEAPSARNSRGDWVIGSLNNVHGVRQADILSDRSLGEWITDALLLELKHAGYSPAYMPALPADAANGILISDIRGFLNLNKGLVSVDTKHELRFNVDLFRNGAKVKSFAVVSRDSQKLALNASREEQEQIMRASLQDAMQQIMPEVISLTGGK